jgi:hypothetical protein
MKKISLYVASAALAAFVGLSQAAPYSAWTKYREVTINTTAGGANVAGTVTNFPVLVRLSNASEGAGASVLSEALTGGADVRFTDSTGNTALGYEIESWSATSAAIWVKVPVVTGNSSTKIRLYWNRSGAPNASSGASVFGSNNFLGVWHLGNGTGTAARPNSVAPGTNDAIPSGTDAANMVPKPGVVGLSDSLRAQAGASSGQATDDHFNLGQITFPDSQVTVSMWVLLPDPQRFIAWNHFFSHGNTNLEDNLWIGRENNTTNLRARGSHGGAESGDAASTTITGGLATLNTWMHFAVSKDSSGGRRWRVYKDGVRQINFYGANDNHMFVPGTRTQNFIGRSLWPDANSHIKVDEMRTSSVARSADWMKLEYETQKAGATALTLGAAVTQSVPELSYLVKNATYLVGQAIATNTFVSSGTPTGFSVLPALPAGLTLNANGTITGTPTAATASTSYVVSATLNAATVKDTLVLAVSGGTPPGAPTGVAGLRGSRQVTVSWTAPSSSGTSAITGYKAMVVGDSTTKTCTSNAATLSCVITGLTNGTAYTFQVRAVSAVGSSGLSAASLPVTPAGVPSAPTITALTQSSAAPGTATATLTWTAPASDSGSAITEYFTTSTPSGPFCNVPVGTLTCSLSGLAYGTAYSIRVFATNAVGSGSLSNAVSITATGIRSLQQIVVSGAVKPFTFVLSKEVLATSEKLTMSISDVYGRTVWSKTVNPKKMNGNEMTWNGKSSNGRAASAGVYFVKVSTVVGGKAVEFNQKAVTIKPL